MGIVGDALAAVAAFSLSVIDGAGYLGLFLLMVGESMVLPIPSEAVLPFAGFLVATGEMSLGAVLVVAALGSLAGSLLSYWLGSALTPLVERYGKYVFVHKSHLHATHRFLARRGSAAVFLSRFVPGWRHVVSIPAGTARMPVVPFSIATTAGAFLWNAILVWAGYKLGENWRAIEGYKPYLDGAVLGVAALALVVALVAWRRRARRQDGTRAAEPPTLDRTR